jgi:hypothetical protein
MCRYRIALLACCFYFCAAAAQPSATPVASPQTTDTRKTSPPIRGISRFLNLPGVNNGCRSTALWTFSESVWGKAWLTSEQAQDGLRCELPDAWARAERFTPLTLILKRPGTSKIVLRKSSCTT